MKIRITDKGFANLTGLFGTIEFVDGVSVDSVSRAEAARLGTILSIEEVETGLNPSTTQLMVDVHNKNTEELGLREAGLRKVVPGEVQASPEVIDQATMTVQQTADAVNRSVLSYDYTEDELAAIADREGIAGLRAFADKYKVNDKSVAGLVKKLLALKAEHAKPEQVEPEAVVEKPEADVELDDVEFKGPGDEVTDEVKDPVEVADAEELEKALGDVEQE
jgi:hypothetical protein